jgi:hypothetical protein
MSINKNILIFFIFCLIFINFGCKISKDFFDINEKFSDDEYEDEGTNEAENVDEGEKEEEEEEKRRREEEQEEEEEEQEEERRKERRRRKKKKDDCKDSDDILGGRPSKFSINNCIDCMQEKLCKKYQKRLCGFTNSNDATQYLIKKCKNYCTETTGRRYGDVTKFNEKIVQIGILKDALCKKFK